MRFFLFLLTLMLINLPALHKAQADSEGTRINMGQLQESIKQHEEKIAESDEEEFSLYEELRELDDSLDKQQKNLENLHIKQDEQRQLIANRTRELHTLSILLEKQQEHLVKRMQSYYLMGITGLLNALFSSQTLPDLVLNNQAFRSLVTYDQQLVLEYRRSMQQHEEARKSLEQEQGLLSQLIHDAEREEKALEDIIDKKKELLHQVQTQKSLYALALKEMHKAEGELAATLQKEKDKENHQIIQNFLDSKGKLSPPISGRIIRRYLEPGPPGDAAPFANGITISVDDETKVKAVYEGVVIFAEYMPGYGKMVIVEHAQQYYTVIAKFSKIQVKENDVVEQGDILGTTDTLATLVGKGLYFEIRHGAIAENPEDWLRPGSLQPPQADSP
jgi:septal ring factor EnvC (AmiA/AmiB activator)